ncbi:MAG: NAD-dependent epimerase/dehydratase family protein [Asticcacaulis sp.]
MRYLVTGSAGFIGFHLIRRLIADGHVVHGFDGMTNYYNPRLKEARVAELLKLDGYTHQVGRLEDRDALEAAFATSEAEVVVHLAAQAGVRYSLENPKSYIDSNEVGSWNMLDIARNANIKHVMLASTSSVYGANPTVPFYETDRADEPLTVYAATKKAAETMAHAYAHLYKLPVTAFRFFTVYGPWGRPDMALFKFVKAALEGREIEIYGEGRMSRDFTYIDDLIEAMVRLCAVPPSEDNRMPGDTLSAQGPFRVVNIGGGQPVGLIDFVDTVEEALTSRGVVSGLKRKMLPMQKGDVPRTYASPRLMESLIDYCPSTDVKAGVGAFVDWYLEKRSLFED